MTINFTNGFVKVINKYYKPENITYIENDTVYLKNGEKGYIYDGKEFVNAVIKAENTGEIIDLSA